MPSFSNLNDRYGGKTLIRLLALLLALGCLVIPHQATGQVKPLLDNDQVRIFEATIKVGEKTPEHSHPADEATYVLSGGKIKLTLPNGTTSTAERKTGEMRWRTEPETHVAENVGDTELRFLIIQLKKPPGAATGKGTITIPRPRPSEQPHLSFLLIENRLPLAL